MSNILLSLDESTVATGYAIFKDKELMEYGVLQFKSKNVLERISEISYAVEDLIKQYKVDTLVIENIMITMSAPTAKALMGLELILELIAFRNDIPCTALRTTNWRKTLGLSNSPKLKRPEKKQQTIDYVNNKYNLSICKDDVSDAIAIGTAFIVGKEE